MLCHKIVMFILRILHIYDIIVMLERRKKKNNFLVLGRNKVLMWLVLWRMYRLRKVFELFSRMEKSMVGVVSSKAMKSLAINLLLFHVGGCAYFYSAINTPPGEEGNTWIGSLTLGEQSYKNFRHMGFWKLYVTSFYFAAMTVTTVGKLKINQKHFGFAFGFVVWHMVKCKK